MIRLSAPPDQSKLCSVGDHCSLVTFDKTHSTSAVCPSKLNNLFVMLRMSQTVISFSEPAAARTYSFLGLNATEYISPL